MKYLLVIALAFGFQLKAFSQTLVGPSGYRVVDLGDNGQGDYTRSLILLHEAYNGTPLSYNNAVGTITAARGNQSAYNRVNIAYINTASVHTSISGMLQSFSNNLPWKFKTCIYNGKKYLALEVPQGDAYHDIGYKFSGWSNSTGENLKCVNYMVQGQPVNQNILSDIRDYKSDMTENHEANQVNILGSLNVGTETANPEFLFQVKGKIRSEEIKVETANWPDYVFAEDYKLPSLKETEQHIKEQGHLPGIPSAAEVNEHGINLGDMNAKLLKKIEELTLLLIQQNKRIEILEIEHKSKK